MANNNRNKNKREKTNFGSKLANSATAIEKNKTAMDDGQIAVEDSKLKKNKCTASNIKSNEDNREIDDKKNQAKTNTKIHLTQLDADNANEDENANDNIKTEGELGKVKQPKKCKAWFANLFNPKKKKDKKCNTKDELAKEGKTDIPQSVVIDDAQVEKVSNTLFNYLSDSLNNWIKANINEALTGDIMAKTSDLIKSRKDELKEYREFIEKQNSRNEFDEIEKKLNEIKRENERLKEQKYEQEHILYFYNKIFEKAFKIDDDKSLQEELKLEVRRSMFGYDKLYDINKICMKYKNINDYETLRDALEKIEKVLEEYKELIGEDF